MKYLYLILDGKVRGRLFDNKHEFYPIRILLPDTKILTVTFSFKYLDFSQVSQIC